MKRWIGTIRKDPTLSLALLILRLAAGGLMVFHGMGKFADLLAGKDQFYDFIGLGPVVSLGLAVFAEFFCAILVLVGLYTRLACIPLIITMAVACFLVHAGDPISDRELSIFFLANYCALAITGPGAFSVDRLIKA